MIDWEYSAMASPYWDLATLCNAAQLDLAQSRQLLRDYCTDAAQMKESTLFDYRGLLKLLNDCWMAALAD
jgi:thiamine kinase-like enzyme